MTSHNTNLQEITRRQLFQTCGVGLGKISLASLLASQLPGAVQANDQPTDAGLHHPRAPNV